jgi:hypothetical protein
LAASRRPVRATSLTRGSSSKHRRWRALLDGDVERQAARPCRLSGDGWRSGVVEQSIVTGEEPGLEPLLLERLAERLGPTSPIALFGRAFRPAVLLRNLTPLSTPCRLWRAAPRTAGRGAPARGPEVRHDVGCAWRAARSQRRRGADSVWPCPGPRGGGGAPGRSRPAAPVIPRIRAVAGGPPIDPRARSFLSSVGQRA